MSGGVAALAHVGRLVLARRRTEGDGQRRARAGGRISRDAAASGGERHALPEKAPRGDRGRACLQCGQPRRALQAVQEMKGAGWVPDTNTYDALLQDMRAWYPKLRCSG